MAEEKKEIRIAARLPVAIVEKIDEAIAAGLAKTRSGFIREVVARSFDERRSILSRVQAAKFFLDAARQPGGFSFAYGFLSGVEEIIEYQVREAEAQAERVRVARFCQAIRARPSYLMGPKHMKKWRSPLEEEGAVNGSKERETQAKEA